MKKKQLMVLILLLMIGFATVSATLVINGVIGVGVDLDDFDVIFVEALLDGKNDDKVIISKDKKTVTFSTDKLSVIGESAKLDYKVKNTSTQYDADVTIICTNEASDYVTVTSSFDGNSIPLVTPINIEAQEIKDGYINAELTRSYLGEDASIKISCEIEVNATSRDKYAYSLNFDSNGGSKVEDKSVALNDSYGKLGIPTRKGYIFLGWYDEFDVQVDEETILDSKGNRTLYAKWEANNYPVGIFTNTNGNSESNTLYVPYGNSSNIKITPSSSYYISNIECDNGYTVENYDLKVHQYGEQTIEIKNNETDKPGSCTFSFAQEIYTFNFTGSEQEFSIPHDGNYKIELWGASGGNANGIFNNTGGKGAYVSGTVLLGAGTPLFINVGGKGEDAKNIGVNNDGNLRIALGGYNGGGNASGVGQCVGAGGGGATHVALASGILSSLGQQKDKILIVASAGGGASLDNDNRATFEGSGGSGGILNGYDGNTKGNNQCRAYGATQTYGGRSCSTKNYGFFGGSDYNVLDGSCSYDGGAGGAGLYGGGNSVCSGGGGGSSYINENTLFNSFNSKYLFYNISTHDGESDTMPTHDGTSTMKGNTGNGYAKIIYLGE